MLREWKHGEDVLAEKIEKDRVPGILRKRIAIKTSECLIIEKDNEIFDVCDSPGTSLGFLDKDFTRAIFVDRSIKSMRFGEKNIRARTGLKLGLDFEITFRAVDPVKVVENLFLSRRYLYLKDVWDMVHMDICELLEPEMSKKSIREIVSDEEFMEKTERSIKEFLTGKFQDFGLSIISFHLFWEPPKNYEEKEKEEPKEEKKETEKEEKGDKEKKELEDLLEAKKKLEEKHKKGEISDEAFRGLMEGYEKRIKEAEK